MTRALAVLALLASPAFAQQEVEQAFVADNLRAILYHELAHAIIDLAALPVFGQEEDAADVASVLLVHDLFEEDSAVRIIYASAFAYLAEASEREETGEDVAWWDVHGPDLQRYYTQVCLFVGADLDGREDIAEELGLPEERLESCTEEFELAYDSWGPVFDELGKAAPGNSLRYRGDAETLAERTISEEVAELNLDFVLPEVVDVHVTECGEANAFYDPNLVEITICTEFADWLLEAARSSQE